VADIYAVDLFCGAGGLTYGFEQAGLPVIAGYDIDQMCQFPYETNNKAKFICSRVEDIVSSELIEIFPTKSIKVLVGCTPCQPFSTYSRRYLGKNQGWEKWQLLRDFVRLVEESYPEVVSMENVLQLKQHAVFLEFVLKLQKLSYHTKVYEVNCQEYGVPQTRKRLVLFASKFGEVEMLSPTHNKDNYNTVRKVIGDLEPLIAGQSSEVDRLHRCSKLSELNLQRIRASKPGGTWRDWSEDLIASCHTKKSGKTYPGVYGRMEWDSLSPTITTQCFGFGNGRFGHPNQDRAISLREAALLQTFPPDYEFVLPAQPVKFSHIGRLIGNAVPVKLGKAIAQSILNHVNSVKP